LKKKKPTEVEFMKYNPRIHNRRSIRLKGYDYAQAGFYFVTICCHDRTCLFGNISAAKSGSTIDKPTMVLNDAGMIANCCWLEIPDHFPNVVLHEHILMPNHIHGIIEFVGAKNIIQATAGAKNIIQATAGAKNIMQAPVGAKNISPLRGPSKTIGSVIRGFKIGVTKWMRQNTNIYDVWQRNYYEHIIRNEHSYRRISEYIINNPAKWIHDQFYINQNI
jgi:REP element-mobilizing transposase RayT